MRPKPIFPKICLYGQDEAPRACILNLPGRAQSGFSLAQLYRHYSLIPHTMVIGITPRDMEWYPMPNGVNDQEEAVEGQWRAIETVDHIVQIIEKRYGINSSKILLAGYSAGAVVSLLSAIHLKHHTFAGVVAHAGAILDTDSVIPCSIDTPILLIHARDDNTFDWYERYIPMKASLIRAGYTVYSREKDKGGHGLCKNDLILAGKFANNVLC
jgi:predicted esterase